MPAALLRRIDRQVKAGCVDAAAFAKLAPEFKVASLGVMAAETSFNAEHIGLTGLAETGLAFY